MQRVCSRCGTEKPLTSEFFISSRHCRFSLTWTCRTCSNAWHSKYKNRNKAELARRKKEIREGKQKIKDAAKIAQHPFKWAANSLMSGLRDRVKTHNYFCDPELRKVSFLETWLMRQPNCECCNIAFTIGPKPHGKALPTSPSLDRFDLTKGYTLDNTALICWRCNKIKGNFSHCDLITVATWIDRRQSLTLEQTVS